MHPPGPLPPAVLTSSHAPPAFVPPKPAVRGLFNTRDRAEHTRKRKVRGGRDEEDSAAGQPSNAGPCWQIVSHTFAPKSIVAFEPFIRREVQLLLERWDEFTDEARKNKKPGPRGLNGRAWLDALLWLNFFAFDSIAVLAFGKSECEEGEWCTHTRGVLHADGQSVPRSIWHA